MNPIVVGDDGSDDAAAAIRWAARWADAQSCRMVAVHVVRDRSDSDGDDDMPERVVRVGHPVRELIDVAHDLDASAVVLGRRGAGGFTRAALGGVAYQVAATSDVPVVVVPANATARASTTVGEVVVGVDGMPETTDAARWATKRFGDAHFTAVHALELAPAFAQADAERATGDLYDAARTRAEQLMHERFVQPFREANVSFDALVEEGGAVEILIDAIHRVSADLVVVGRRDRHLRRGTLGGVSQRVLAYAPCPAAMVPSPA
jgi:nucleotide-binding universal stress UspA family protein